MLGTLFLPVPAPVDVFKDSVVPAAGPVPEASHMCPKSPRHPGVRLMSLPAGSAGIDLGLDQHHWHVAMWACCLMWAGCHM
jgi:hypothetical protein